MTRRNQTLDHLLLPVQQRRLCKLWVSFQDALSEQPRNQARINRLRAQLPPQGLRWPWWEVVLRGRVELETAA